MNSEIFTIWFLFIHYGRFNLYFIHFNINSMHDGPFIIKIWLNYNETVPNRALSNILSLLASHKLNLKHFFSLKLISSSSLISKPSKSESAKPIFWRFQKCYSRRDFMLKIAIEINPLNHTSLQSSRHNFLLNPLNKILNQCVDYEPYLNSLY